LFARRKEENMLHVHCQQPHLAHALSHLNKITPQKSPLPILTGIHLIATQDTLTLVSTDLVVGVRVTIPAKVEREGKSLVPFKSFVEFVNTLAPLPLYRAAPLVLQQDESPLQEQKTANRMENTPVRTTPLHLTSEQVSPTGNTWSNSASFSAWRDEDYPWVPPTHRQGERYTVDAYQLRKALAASRKFTFRGTRTPGPTFDDVVMLHTEGEKLSVHASSESTTSHYVLPLVNPVTQPGCCQFEAPLLAEIEAILPKTGTTHVSFHREENADALFLEIEPGCVFFCRGSGLPLAETITSADEAHMTELVILRKALLEGLKSATALDRKQGGREEVTLTGKEHTLLFHPYPDDPTVGDSSVSIPIMDGSGDGISIRLGWQKLRFMLEGLSSETLRLQIGHTLGVGKRRQVLRAEPVPADGSFLQLVEREEAKEHAQQSERSEGSNREQAMATP